MCEARARQCEGNFENWWIWARCGFVLAYFLVREEGVMRRMCEMRFEECVVAVVNCEFRQKEVFGLKKLKDQIFTPDYYIICVMRKPSRLNKRKTLSISHALPIIRAHTKHMN